MPGAVDYNSQKTSRRRTPSRGTPRTRRPALSARTVNGGAGWWDREHGCTWGLFGRPGGGGEQGPKSRLVVAPACSLRSSSRLQSPTKTRTYSCARDSLQIARPGRGKGRGSPSRPGGLLAPPGDFLRPAPPSGTQRTPVSFVSLPQKKHFARTLDGGGVGLLFLFTPCGFALVCTRHLKIQLRKSHGVVTDNLICSPFCSKTKQFYSKLFTPPVIFGFSTVIISS